MGNWVSQTILAHRVEVPVIGIVHCKSTYKKNPTILTFHITLHGQILTRPTLQDLVLSLTSGSFPVQSASSLYYAPFSDMHLHLWKKALSPHVHAAIPVMRIRHKIIPRCCISIMHTSLVFRRCLDSPHVKLAPVLWLCWLIDSKTDGW